MCRRAVLVAAKRVISAVSTVRHPLLPSSGAEIGYGTPDEDSICRSNRADPRTEDFICMPTRQKPWGGDFICRDPTAAAYGLHSFWSSSI
jgi:hypothetical protein